MPSLPIRMPQLGESAAEAVVREWLIDVGEPVEVDQDLIEVETEKSVLTVTAPATGILLSQDVAADQACAVGEVLGSIEVDKDSPLAEKAQSAGAAAATSTSAPTPPTSQASDDHGVAAMPSREGDLPVPARTAGLGYFSPRLRARMSEFGLRNADITGVRGTGRAGRVSVKDLERFLEEIDQGNATNASPMRVAVADSMRRSWNRPLATIAVEARMDALMEHRRTVEGRPSATVYAVAALAQALAKDDRLACRLVGKKLVHPSSMDIAVAIEAEDGVVNPVIKDASNKDLAALQKDYQQAFEAAAERRVLPDNSGASVATVSNYGTFNIVWATPVPLPDQSVILGVGAVRNMPDWDPKSQGWGRKRAAELTLTFDHRVADGGGAGRLLKAIADLLEHPEKISLG